MSIYQETLYYDPEEPDEGFEKEDDDLVEELDLQVSSSLLQ